MRPRCSIFLRIRRSAPRVKAKPANNESGRCGGDFKVSLAARDMRLVVPTGEDAGVDLKASQSVRQWLDEAAARARLTWTSRQSPKLQDVQNQR